MKSQRVLVGGVGNIFLGDDAFGVEVVQQMWQRPCADGVEVRDFGIRGLDLTYALLEDYDVAILVDATPRGGTPGTLYLIEPESAPAASSGEEGSSGDLVIETHGMHPAKVLRLVAEMGGKLGRVLIVGCEPTPVYPEQDMDMSMSATVRAAVPRAVEMIEELVAKIRGNELQAMSVLAQEGESWLPA